AEFFSAQRRFPNQDLRMKQRVHGNIVLRPELAGEPNTGGRANASERSGFEFVRQRKSSCCLIDPDTTSGTAGTTATAGDMRAVQHGAEFQNRKPNRRFNLIIPWIGDCKMPMASPPITQLRGSDDPSDQGQPGISDPFFQLRAGHGAPWISRDPHRFHTLEPRRIGGSVRAGGHPDFGKPEERTGWNKDIGEQNCRKRALVPGANSQQKMQADREMTPDEKNEEYLLVPGPGIDPKVGDFVGIVDIDAGEDAGPARIDDVNEQQIGDS